MTIGTVIGAVAAVGSLLFTGIATYYGAVIARQQLDQSREDSEKDARSQAARVTFWMEQGSTREDRAVHLVNRSPDAVTGGGLWLNTTYRGGEGQLLIPDISLPPCTEVIFGGAEMYALITRDAEAEGHVKDFTWDVDVFGFTDSAGQRWVRSPTFLKYPEEARETKTVGLIIAEPTKTTALKECGSDK